MDPWEGVPSTHIMHYFHVDLGRLYGRPRWRFVTCVCITIHLKLLSFRLIGELLARDGSLPFLPWLYIWRLEAVLTIRRVGAQ